jgi:hypothetical protein
MLRSLLLVSLLSLLAACAHQLPEERTLFSTLQQPNFKANYNESGLQKIQWLSGAWKGKDAGKSLKKSFLFHTDQILEVMLTEAGNQKASQFFSWKDGHFYYGQNRQWVVTWISEKNIRFDPVLPGFSPMTWSKVHENEWHLQRHTEAGDETIVLERSSDLPS